MTEFVELSLLIVSPCMRYFIVAIQEDTMCFSIVNPIPILPRLEPRLQRRYKQLVIENLNSGQSVAAGLRALPTTKTSFASTQAAWRFYANEQVSLVELAEPLIEYARKVLAEVGHQYALVVHDWSHINYNNHSSKKERKVLSHSKDIGYELKTSLLISDRSGTPIAPLSQDLLASDGIHSTCSESVQAEGSHLDDLTETIRFIDGLQLGKPTVHIIDREADSVLHYRLWSQEGRFFIVRANCDRIVKHEGKDKTLSEVAEQVKFRYNGEVEYKGKPAKQYIAETRVTLDRPARPRNKQDKSKCMTVRGQAIRLRLIVSQVRDEDGKLLAEWFLLTNLPSSSEIDGVSGWQIALWYYWRWRIETYFKLLKSAGHNMEQWQQESAQAIAKRLLVTSMACVVVWQLARSSEPEAVQLRQILIRLSGRQMKPDKPWTEPALLAGMWTLLAILEVIECYGLQQLRQLARYVWPTQVRGRVKM